MITTINEFRKFNEATGDEEEIIDRKWIPDFLYHISATKNKESILKNGIKMSTGGGTWFGRTYSNRVYMATSLIAAYDLQLNFKAHEMADDYLIFKIELDKIPNGAPFYNDSLFNHGIYTEQSIPKSAIIDVINPDTLSYPSEDLENLYNSTWMEYENE
jgi:hypothetical protein